MRVAVLVICVCICAFGLLELSEWKVRENPLNKVMELEIFDIYDIQDQGKIKYGIWNEDGDVLATVLYARNENKNGDGTAIIRGSSLRKTRGNGANAAAHFDIDQGSALSDDFEEEWSPHALPLLADDDYPSYTTMGEAQRLRKGLEDVYEKLCDAKAEMENAVRYAFLLGAMFATILILFMALLNQMCRHYRETHEWCPKPAGSTVSTYTSGGIPGSISNSEAYSEAEEVGTRV